MENQTTVDADISKRPSGGGDELEMSIRPTKSGKVTFNSDTEWEVYPNYGLQIKEAYKSIGNTWVLKGLNMFVPSASIYALLGPSGCGKTTLLNCCVGIANLDSGTISMETTKRSEIGYMPQNTGLYLLLSVSETFQYYGRIFGMKPEAIKRKHVELTELLQLPKTSRTVETFSGGEQRRVSFAVALLHDPKLLILDEPTVGLDPILSKRLWKHLLDICSEGGKTILITTHYIEEARQAHTVGMMRCGVLLCEDSPSAVMSSQNCDTLENAFLNLSTLQENTEKYCDSRPDITKPRRFSVGNTHSSPIEKTPLIGSPGLLAELIKNMFFIWRNKSMLIFTFGMPLIVSVAFHLAIGGIPSGLKMAVVNDEVPGGLPNCKPTIQSIQGCNFTGTVSCRFLKQIKRLEIDLLDYDNVEIAKEAVVKNTAWGAIHFGRTYTQDLAIRMERNLRTPDEIIEKGSPAVWLDMSNHNIGYMLKIKLYSGFSETMKELLRDCGWSDQSMGIPIRIQDPVYGEKTANINHYASPAIIVLLMFSLPMLYAIGVIIQEKTTGVLQRSMISGVSTVQVFLSHILIQMAMLIIQMGIVIHLMFYTYGIPFKGNPIWSSSLLLLQGFSGLSFGFLLAVLFDRVSYATLGGTTAILAFLLVSGIIWPQAGLHTVLKWTKWISPTTYSVESLRAITVRGWSLERPIVASGFISIIGWGIAYILISQVIIQFRDGTGIK